MGDLLWRYLGDGKTALAIKRGPMGPDNAHEELIKLAGLDQLGRA